MGKMMRGLVGSKSEPGVDMKRYVSTLRWRDGMRTEAQCSLCRLYWTSPIFRRCLNLLALHCGSTTTPSASTLCLLLWFCVTSMSGTS